MSSSPTPASPKSNRWVLPLLVFIAALGIRLLGIGWGLPNNSHQQSLHPDEPVVWYYSQNIQPTALDFTPAGFYNYGTFYLTALKVASDVTAAYGGGGIDSKDPDSAWKYIGKTHLAGRILSALAGAGTALVVFLTLRRFSNELGSAFGGLFVALAPAHVVHSRFQTVDVFATFLIALSAYFALSMISSNREEESPPVLKLAVLSGVFAGLSAGTKYTGILCLATLWVVAFGTGGTSKWKLALAGTMSAALAFVLSTPGVFLESQAFWSGFMYETAHVKSGHGLIFEGTSSGFIYHFANLFFGAGLLMGVLGIAGLLGAGIRRNLWAIAILAFVVPYFVLIAGAEVKFIRYTFPLYIGLAVGFGWVVGKAREKGGNWHGVVALGMLALGGVFGGGLQSSAKFTAWMLSPDPREAAGEYLRSSAGTVGLVSDPWFYTPTIHPALGRRLIFETGLVQVALSGYGEYFDRATASMRSPRILRYVPALPDGSRDLAARFDWDERLLTESKPDFVVFSSFENEGLDRISKLANPSPAGATATSRAKLFMERLKIGYTFDRAFGHQEPMVHDMMYVQPTIWVWKRKQGS